MYLKSTIRYIVVTFVVWFTVQPSAQATVLCITEGVNSIHEAVSAAASGDSLMLTTSGGHYHQENVTLLRRKSLTIIADSTITNPSGPRIILRSFALPTI